MPVYASSCLPLFVGAWSFALLEVIAASAGQHAGEHGEFYRYVKIYGKPPDDNDKREMIEMAADVKCDVCETILLSLISRATSNSEDDIMDELEGVGEPPILTEDKQDNRVKLARKGCNKHFKDELLHMGYTVKKCLAIGGTAEITEAIPPQRPKTFCLANSTVYPSERTVNTYNQRSEVAFYACEHTVGRHGLELGPFLAKILEEGDSPATAARRGCLEVADCDGVRLAERRRSAQQRQKEPSPARAKPRKAEAGHHEEESYLDIIAREKGASRKRRKKSRKRSGTHSEL